MEKMQNISVVIPLFNRQDLVVETLESIEQQILLPYEVVIVNDKSTDNSASVVKHYAKTSKLKINLIENKRKKGMCGALNTGIENAQGEYVAFQDSDDLWTPIHLQQLLFALDKYKQVSIAFSKIEIFGDAKDAIQKMNDFKISVSRCLECAFEKKDEKNWLSNKNLLYALLQWGFPFRCPASLIKKEFFFKYSLFFDEEIIYTLDSQFMTIAAYYTPFIYVEDIGLRIRRHFENDGDKSYGDKISNSYEKRIFKLKSFFCNKKLNLKEKKAFNRCIWRLQSFVIESKWGQMSLMEKIKEIFKLYFIFPSLMGLKYTMKLVTK